MHLRITVADPRRPRAAREVLVEAVAGSTAAELAAALDVATLAVDGRLLPGEHPIGMPPLLDGALVTVSWSDAVRPRVGDGLLELHVLSGPDAGQVFALPPGAHRLGRAAEAHLRLDDPEISRVHAQITVDSAGVAINDLGSANGTLVDEARVGHGPVTITPDSRVRVGSSTLRLRLPSGSPAAARPDGLGHIRVNRRPRVRPPEQVTTIAFPELPPPYPTRSRLPLLAMLAPLAVSAMLAAVTQAPAMLLFGLVSPVLLLGTWFGERRGGRGRLRRLSREHESSRDAAQRHLDAAVCADAGRLREDHPDLAELLRTAEARLARLWERRRDDEDALVVRLGTGSRASRVQVSGQSAPRWPPPMDGAPITCRLRELGVLGVAGPRAPVVAQARGLLAQLAAWHSPVDLRLFVLSDRLEYAREWAWAALLPHTALDGQDPRGRSVAALELDTAIPDEGVVRCLDELGRLLADRVGGAQGPGPRHEAGARSPDVVVLLDGAVRLRMVPGLSTILEWGPAAGIYVIALDTTAERLPAEARAVVTLTSGSHAELALPSTREPVGLVPDTPGARWAERFGRALAPLRDATPGLVAARIPGSVRLLDLLDDDVLTPHGVAARWDRQLGTTEVTLGVGSEGPLRLDLSDNGPHVLVAGTTGAGKSELLQTLVASLALSNRPDRLAMVLIDYKGGAAFRACSRLPHTVGVVTDLDEHLTARALTSLRAELRRRERLLAQAGVSDIDDHHRMPSGPPCPRLLIVIDEFRALAEELPDFVQGLVRLAAVGRSLGIHLVLATQRPGGAVSADIRANVSLRIALRVRDRTDSTDVVDAPDAASISAATPGRAFLRGAASPLTEFQTARVTGTTPARRRVRVSAMPRSESVWSQHGDETTAGSATTDLHRIVEATRAAAARHGIPRLPPPWLPPLPDVVPLEDLAATTSTVPLGLRDDPVHQCQTTFGWDLGGGHLGIAGGPASGRTTAVRTVAGALARAYGADGLHLYAVGAGPLPGLDSLPHTAVVAAGEDTHLATLVVARLRSLLRERRARLAAERVSTLVEQRLRATAEGRAVLPWLVLLVDGWESLVQGLAAEPGTASAELMPLLREGGAAGLRMVVTGERSLLSGPLASVLTTRLVLRMSDPLQLALAGIPASAVPRHQPPGRALDVETRQEVQLAVLGEDPAPHAQVSRLEQIGRFSRGAADGLDPALLPRPVSSLPALVHLSALGQALPSQGSDRDGVLLVAAREGDLAPVGFTPALGHRRLLVVGPARSGRTTTLVVLARSLVQRGWPVAVVGRTLAGRTRDLGVAAVGLDGLDRPGELAAAGRDELVRLRRERPDLALLVDDAELLADPAVETVVREAARRVDEAGGLVAAATTATALLGAFGTVQADLARARTGLLLCPASRDGDAFGVRVAGTAERTPGRGLLVRDGTTVGVQVALPD